MMPRRTLPVFLLVLPCACDLVWPEVNEDAVAELDGVIVFQALVDGGEGFFSPTGIFVLDLDAATLTQLTDSLFPSRDPSLSPSGDRIAFSGSVEDGGTHIFLMDLDGGNLTQLTTGDCDASGPSWSPSGDHIAFDCRPSPQRILVMNADGSGQREIASLASQPSWSPQGDRLAYTHEQFGGIYAVDLSGENVRRLSEDSVSEYQPAWSPDGSKIAFARSPPSIYSYVEVWIMNADGSGATQVTPAPDYEHRAEMPTWSPNGEKIVYSGYDGLYVINADGTYRRRIVQKAGAKSPDWR